MARIVVVGTSPLLADGVAAALRGVDGWDVRIGGVDDGADCWVLPGAELVVRGPGGASAHLAADCAAGRLRAAVGAVLEGLSVREAPWPAPAPEETPTARLRRPALPDATRRPPPATAPSTSSSAP